MIEYYSKGLLDSYGDPLGTRYTVHIVWLISICSSVHYVRSYDLSFHSARRNTLGHFPDRDKRPASLSGRSYDDNTDPAQRPRYPETKADIERALKSGNGEQI